MRRHFEIVVFAVVAIATAVVLFYPWVYGTHVAPSSSSENGGGYIGQYLSTAVVTLIAVAIINRFRDDPINRWRAVMLMTAVVLVLNMAVLLHFRLPSLLTPGAFMRWVFDVTFGGWIVLLGSWYASVRLQHRNAPDPDETPVDRVLPE